MIIDDSSMDNLLHKVILERSGFSENILIYTSPESALQYLASPENKIPEIIFVDINMPEMSGFEFVEAFEKFPDNIKQQAKIYIISSSEDEVDIQKASSYKSVSRYLIKPLDKNDLF